MMIPVWAQKSCVLQTELIKQTIIFLYRGQSIRIKLQFSDFYLRL